MQAGGLLACFTATLRYFFARLFHSTASANARQFFRSIQARAFRRAEIASGNSADAMDIVQDAMLKLTEKYATAEPTEWPPLFYRIVQNSIRDWHRRHALRSGCRWLSGDARNAELDNASLSRTAGNRALYWDGVPVATLVGPQVNWLIELDTQTEMQAQSAIAGQRAASGGYRSNRLH